MTSVASKPAPAQPQPHSHTPTLAKARTPRLGRGLSSLMAHTVQVTIPPAAGSTAPQVPAHAATMPHLSAPVVLAASAAAVTRPEVELKQPSDPSPRPATPAATAATATTTPPADGVLMIPLDAIVPNPHQPRQRFDQAALERLAESIRSAGVMQPVIIRQANLAKPGKDGKSIRTLAQPRYELVAGERRWRAARLAGLDGIPALVRSLDDRQVAEWALIENLQREDLNPIERAQAFRSLSEQFKLSHEQIAQRVGVDRSTISNSLRLLVLHQDVQQLIRDNLLSLGQAKAVAGILDPQQQLVLAKRAIRAAWSVRRVEAAVRELLQAGGTSSSPADDAAEDPSGKPASRSASHLADLEQQNGRQLATKVRLRPGRKKGSGSLTIDFYSLDQFDALLARLGVRTD